MDGEDKRYVWIAAIVVGGILAAMITFSTLGSYMTARFVEGGYSEVMVPGRQSPVWQKLCQ